MTEILLKGRKVANRPTILGGDMCIRTMIRARLRYLRWQGHVCQYSLDGEVRENVKRPCGQISTSLLSETVVSFIMLRWVVGWCDGPG